MIICAVTKGTIGRMQADGNFTSVLNIERQDKKSIDIAKVETTKKLEVSDGVLAQRVLDGDQQAFEALVRKYDSPLFHFICHFLGDYDLACDILQQVFLRFYTSLPKLGTNEPFKSWLFQVARNCCVDELRRRRRYAIDFSQLEVDKNDGESSLINDIPDPGPLPEELMERLDLQECLQSAIESLPPKFRAVVLLRYVSQLSFAEIGQTLSMPGATAKTYFHRAKALLRNVLRSPMPTAVED